jgi:hypothetical protein
MSKQDKWLKPGLDIEEQSDIAKPRVEKNPKDEIESEMEKERSTGCLGVVLFCLLGSFFFF